MSNVIKIELTPKMVNDFAIAWHDQDDLGTDYDGYVTGNRRRAGLLAVIELIKQQLRDQGIDIQ